MSLSSRMVIVLTAVGLLSGGFLASVGMLTKERIASNKQMEIERAIGIVVPGTSRSKLLYEEDDFTVYGGEDSEGKLIGLAVHATGVGFQDRITLMFGINTALSRISRLAILDQRETPGLGAKITEQDSFLKFWAARDSRDSLTLHKPAARTVEELLPSEVNTITGATISSRKVLEIVNLSLQRLKNLRKSRPFRSEGNDVH
jgi:electron transport complex protein RnfG